MKYFIFVSQNYNGFNIFSNNTVYQENSYIIFFCLKSLSVYQIYSTKDNSVVHGKWKKSLFIDICNPNFHFIKNIVAKFSNNHSESSEKFITKEIREKDFFTIFKLFQKENDNLKEWLCIHWHEKMIFLFSYGINNVSVLHQNFFINQKEMAKLIKIFYLHLYNTIVYQDKKYYRKFSTLIKKYKKELLKIYNVLLHTNLSIWSSQFFRHVILLYYIVHISKNQFFDIEYNRNTKNIFVLQQDNKHAYKNYFLYNTKYVPLGKKILIIYNWKEIVKPPTFLEYNAFETYKVTFLNGYFTLERFMNQLDYKNIKQNFDIVFYYGHSFVANGKLFGK